MKNTMVIATFAVVIAVSAVYVGGFAIQDQNTSTKNNANAYMVGHLTWIAKDSEGNVKAYQQSDNLIVNKGENCALSRLFSNNTVLPVGACAYQGAHSAANSFNVVSISNNNVTVADSHSSLLPDGAGSNYTGVTGLAPKKAETVSLQVASGTSPASAKITALFVNGDSVDRRVTKAGLQNATANPSALFAAQNLASPGILLKPSDQLTVEWTINIGGTTTFN